MLSKGIAIVAMFTAGLGLYFAFGSSDYNMDTIQDELRSQSRANAFVAVLNALVAGLQLLQVLKKQS